MSFRTKIKEIIEFHSNCKKPCDELVDSIISEVEGLIGEDEEATIPITMGKLQYKEHSPKIYYRNQLRREIKEKMK